jgi:hypothetical protein
MSIVHADRKAKWAALAITLIEGVLVSYTAQL